MYINGNNWEEDFEKIKKGLHGKNNCIIIGDCNVRVGNIQTVHCEINLPNVNINNARLSKDEVVNVRGRKFVDWLDDIGLLILNGRTKGDEEGEMTFVGKMGTSVNDLCAVSYDTLNLINKFQVENEIYSDHLPISLELGINENTDRATELKLLPKLIWRNEREREYRSKLDEKVREIRIRIQQGAYRGQENALQAKMVQ